MKSNTLAARSLEVLALAMIGEGIVGFICPARYLRFWKVGPEPVREFTEYLAEHRDVARLLCLGEISLGLWLAFREIED